MKRARTVTIVFFLPVISIYLHGCSHKFWDPAQIGRFRPVPAVNVILDSLGVAEEAPSAWQGAEDPKPADVMVYKTEYAFEPGDVIRIAVFELFREGTVFADNFLVNETGKISMPEVGIIEVAGLTEMQLEEEIKRILEPSILTDPSVSVTLVNSQRRTYSISGNGVPRPNRYSIPRYDFRLLDALALAGGISQFNISYVYVSRRVTGEEAISELLEPGGAQPQKPEQLFKPGEDMLEIIAPRAQLRPRTLKQPLVIASAEMITDRELAEAALPEGFELPTNTTQETVNAKGGLETFTKPAGRRVIDEPITEEEAERIEWIFKDGKWVPIQTGRPGPIEPQLELKPQKPAEPLVERGPAEFDWDQMGTGGIQTRVIKIPADRLLAGEPRYNIVIRPGDNIQIPVDIIGEFCIMGNVNRVGFIPITGRPMTLKMAIAAAGGLGALACPKRCEVVRRIGRNKEEIVMMNLDKIARGEQPDFFIKPNDMINVGTDATARWRAVLRNAFRATYGYGFVYDRNFADRDYGTSKPFGSIYDKIKGIDIF